MNGHHLGKEKKRVEKSQTPSEASESTGGINPDELVSALEKIRNEQVPTDHDERHQYFMTQVNMGETMSVKGALTEPSWGPGDHLRVNRARFLYACRVVLLPRDSGISFASRVDHGLRKESISARIPGQSLYVMSFHILIMSTAACDATRQHGREFSSFV